MVKTAAELLRIPAKYSRSKNVENVNRLKNSLQCMNLHKTCATIDIITHVGMIHTSNIRSLYQDNLKFKFKWKNPCICRSNDRTS
jgi:hypothetical protein